MLVMIKTFYWQVSHGTAFLFRQILQATVTDLTVAEDELYNSADEVHLLLFQAQHIRDKMQQRGQYRPYGIPFRITGCFTSSVRPRAAEIQPCRRIRPWLSHFDDKLVSRPIYRLSVWLCCNKCTSAFFISAESSGCSPPRWLGNVLDMFFYELWDVHIDGLLPLSREVGVMNESGYNLIQPTVHAVRQDIFNVILVIYLK